MDAGEHTVNVRRRDEASPRVAVGILAAALMLPSALVVAATVITTARRAVVIALALPAITALVVVTAVIALDHLSSGTPAYHRLARTKALARTILLVYLILIVPTALLGMAGQHAQR